MIDRVPVGDCVDSCKSWNPTSGDPEGEFIYIDIASVDRDEKRIVAAARIPRRAAPSRARQLVKVNDVLVSTVRPNLNAVALVPFDLDGSTASTGFTVLRPRVDKVDSAYLFHWVKTPQFIDQMVRQATGASYPAVTDRIVRSAELPLPSLPEQRRIAAILDKADALRAKRREAIAKLDQLLPSLFQELFGDPISNPKGWNRTSLGDVVERITKGESPGWQGFDYQDDGALFVTSENVRLGEIDLSDPKFVPIAFNEKLSRSELRPNDLLVNLVGASIGRSCIFPGYDRPANINQAVAVVTPAESYLDSAYLLGFLTSEQGQGLLLSNRVEGARANISLTDLRDLEIPVPPLERQREYAAMAKAIKGHRRACLTSLHAQDSLIASVQSRVF